MMNSMNIWHDFKNKKKTKQERKIRKAKFNLWRGRLEKHPLTPLLTNRLRLNELEKRFIQKDLLAIEFVEQMVKSQLFHPIPISLFFEKTKEESTQWLNEKQYHQTLPFLISLYLRIFATTGVAGLQIMFELMADQRFKTGLESLISIEGIKKQGARAVFSALASTLHEHQSVELIPLFFQKCVYTDAFIALKKTVFVHGYPSYSLMTETLVSIIKALPLFKNPRNLFKGFELLHHECLNSIKIKRRVNLLPHIFFFGKCLESFNCDQPQLAKAIQLVKGEVHHFHLIHDFERKLCLVLTLINNGFSAQHLRRIVPLFNADFNPIPALFYLELMTAHIQHLDERIEDQCAFLSNLFRTAVGSSYYHSVSTEKYGKLLRDWIQQDQHKVFLRFASVLQKMSVVYREIAFTVGIQLLEATHVMDVLENYLELLEKGNGAAEQLMVKGAGSSRKNSQLELIKTVCLSRCVHRIIENTANHSDHHLSAIQAKIQTCGSPEQIGQFIIDLKKAIALDIDAKEWIRSILPQNKKKPNRTQSDPRALFQLKFEEVEPFLRQYNVSLFGNIPLAISANGTPYTDGNTVYLPAFENTFLDSKQDLFNNRNASLYVSNLFHEVGFHILAGSFLIDSKPTLSQFPNRDLAHLIYNVSEDYRGRQHFFAHTFQSSWIQLIEEDEDLLTRQMTIPMNWRDHFMQLFVSKGSHGKTAGDFDPGIRTIENELLSRSILIFTPPAGQTTCTTLGQILNLLVHHIQTLEGKTVAHTLLLVKPIYQLLSQVIGEDFSYNPKNGRMGLDINQKEGRDCIELSSSEKNQPREIQLQELAIRLQPFQSAPNVPQKIEDWVCEQAGKNQVGGRDMVSNGGGSSGKKRGAGEYYPDKIWVGQYDHITGKEAPCPFPVIAKTESAYHPQFQTLYKKYKAVFKTMEDEVQVLKNQQKIIEIEGKSPDEIILENLVEAIIDPHSIPNLDLYENEEVDDSADAPELELKIVVDASGSTAGIVLEVEKVFASVIFRAFKLLNCKVELYFFEGERETNITKILNLNAIGNVKPGLANRDGAAIRYVANQFKFEAEKSLMIMITDGMPDAFEYNKEKALEDTCHAMKSVIDQGISLYYFNIGGLPDKIFQAFKAHA
ncbi:hypothetical protein KKA14_13960, partial [bacterium]|nr:hypothetical protein [bacterium]